MSETFYIVASSFAVGAVFGFVCGCAGMHARHKRIDKIDRALAKSLDARHHYRNIQ